MNITSSGELARDLAHAIGTGVYSVGSLLPKELDLCESYRLSRYAVRKALDELQAMGLISRRKNVGTRVESATPQAAFVQSIATVAELAKFGAQTQREIQSHSSVTIDTRLAARLGCKGGSQWLRVSSLRLNPDDVKKPVCCTNAFVLPELATVLRDVKKHPSVLMSTLIERRYGLSIARIDQDIHALSLSKDQARLLNADESAPALCIVRRYVDSAGLVFEMTESIHPADRFSFSMQLSRSAA